MISIVLTAVLLLVVLGWVILAFNNTSAVVEGEQIKANPQQMTSLDDTPRFRSMLNLDGVVKSVPFDRVEEAMAMGWKPLFTAVDPVSGEAVEVTEDERRQALARGLTFDIPTHLSPYEQGLRNKEILEKQNVR